MSLISHVFSQKIRFTLLCVFRCLQKVSSKITFLLSIFAAILVVLGPFWLYEEFDDRYPKKLVSVTKKDTSSHIYQSIYISLWFYGSGFGCKNSSKMATFRPNMRILLTQHFLAGAIKPWKWWALTMSRNISKTKKKRKGGKKRFSPIFQYYIQYSMASNHNYTSDWFPSYIIQRKVLTIIFRCNSWCSCKQWSAANICLLYNTKSSSGIDGSKHKYSNNVILRLQKRWRWQLPIGYSNSELILQTRKWFGRLLLEKLP